MAGLMTGYVLDRYPRGGGERLVAIALADNAHRDGTSIYPSVAELSERSMLSRRSVQVHLARMVASGWLILVRKSSGRRGDTNEYRICPAWIKGGECTPPPDPVLRTNAKRPESWGAETAPHEPVDNSPPQSVMGCSLKRYGVQPTAPKPSITCINTPLPPVEAREGDNSESRASEPRKPEAQTSVDQENKAGPDRAPWRWRESRSGIEQQGQCLGLGRWDEAAFGVGQGEPFTRYRQRVFDAADAVQCTVPPPDRRAHAVARER